MNIPFSFDHTGFPLLHLIDLGCYVHLLPVSKAQFGVYAEEHEYTRTVYDEASRANPLDREGPASAVRLENHLMTGVIPSEAMHFAAWMGDADVPDAVFKLPILAEWREIYKALQYELCEPLAGRIYETCPSSAARDILQFVFESRQPHTLLELSLMRAGIVEWVSQGEHWKGLGCPDPAFFPNTFDPLKDEFTPIDPNRRMKAFGFRLIRTFI